MIVTRAGSGESYLTTIAAISICTGVLVHIFGTLDNLRTQYVVALTKEEDEALDEMSFEEVRNFVQKEADLLAKETVEKIPE